MTAETINIETTDENLDRAIAQIYIEAYDRLENARDLLRQRVLSTRGAVLADFMFDGDERGTYEALKNVLGSLK